MLAPRRGACRVLTCATDAVVAEGGATVEIRDTIIESNVGCGVRVSDSTIHLKKCRVKENQRCGIEVTGESSAGDIRKCKVSQNGSHGVSFVTAASVEVAECTILGNYEFGIHSNDNVVLVDIVFAVACSNAGQLDGAGNKS